MKQIQEADRILKQIQEGRPDIAQIQEADRILKQIQEADRILKQTGGQSGGCINTGSVDVYQGGVAVFKEVLWSKGGVVVFKEVWWSIVVSVPASRSPVPGSNLGPAGPPHSLRGGRSHCNTV